MWRGIFFGGAFLNLPYWQQGIFSPDVELGGIPDTMKGNHAFFLLAGENPAREILHYFSHKTKMEPFRSILRRMKLLPKFSRLDLNLDLDYNPFLIGA